MSVASIWEKSQRNRLQGCSSLCGAPDEQEPPSAFICLLSTHWWLTVELRTARLFDLKYLPFFNYLALCPWLTHSRMLESNEWVAINRETTLTGNFTKSAIKAVGFPQWEINIRTISWGFSQTSRLISVLKYLYQQMVLVYSQLHTETDVGFRDIWLIKRLPLIFIKRG